MMNNDFIAESAHIEELDPEFADINIVQKRIDDAKLNTVISNSFGFGAQTQRSRFSAITVKELRVWVT
jgi:3-oxoacyl-[acyl-carrier-protein] synthase-1